MWQGGVFALFSLAAAWEPMPDGYELIDGPQVRDYASIEAWRTKWEAWKDLELKTVRYDANGACNVYNIPSMQWAQRSFVQVFAMMHDRTLYDRERNVFTVDLFLSNIGLQVDSVLIWPSYPNLGIDARNQWDLWYVLPNGIDGLRSLVDDFHANNVTVFIPYQPWDTATRNVDPTTSRYKSDIATIQEILKITGADGVNGDTMYGVPASFYNCSSPTIVCPEGGLPSHTLSVNAMSWGYFYGFSEFPPIARSKFLEPRHTPLICSRWSLSRSVEIQMTFFNGAGYVIWENIWGIWNAMTPREWEELKRTSAILQRFPETMHSLSWKPLLPDLPQNIHGSSFPQSHYTVYTFIHTAGEDYNGFVTLATSSKDVDVYDLYHGAQLNFTAVDGSITIPFEIEGYGYGAILVHERSISAPSWLPSFLTKMQNMTKQPLRSKGTDRPLLQQTMTSLPASVTTSSIVSLQEEKYPNTDHLSLTPITGSEAWQFTVNGVQIEPVLKWTPRGDEIYGVGVQFPWENRPTPHHNEELWLDDFEIMKYPVTNAQFRSFLLQSNYTPTDLSQFLLTWENRTTQATNVEYKPIHTWNCPSYAKNHPVVHVSIEDAKAFASYYGLRLPHDWEWQYVASNGDKYTKYPWGNNTNQETHPPIQRGEEVKLAPVGSFPNGCSVKSQVCDLYGHIWEMTDTFCDSRTCSLLLRGGSVYQPIASSLNDPNWYFPALKSVQEHGKWLLLSQSYDRSATVGFRCVREKRR